MTIVNPADALKIEEQKLRENLAIKNIMSF